MKLTQARPGDLLRGPDGETIEIVAVFTCTVRRILKNLRAADYRHRGGRQTFRVYADEDDDKWTRVAAD